MIKDEMRNQIMQQMRGAMTLQVAYVGVANPLLATIWESGKVDAKTVAMKCGLDATYVSRWCDAAYAFELLEREGEKFTLTELGNAFIPGIPGSGMPMAAASVLSGHMAERATTFMKNGEQPGEAVLCERESIARMFGPMLEGMFGGLFSSQILPNLPEFQELNEKNGVAVDLGCGNGWYLRALLKKFPNLRGVGLDGFEENVRHAINMAGNEGLSTRLDFSVGDIYHFVVEEPVDLIAMNRVLHHVWQEKETVFRILSEHLKPGGIALIWEPNWSGDIEDLRKPGKAPLAFQNLAEHIQGNHFLRPDEIIAEFQRVGMEARLQLFANDNEAVIVGRKR